MAKSIPWLIAGICVGTVIYMGIDRFQERQAQREGIVDESSDPSPPPRLATGDPQGADPRAGLGGATPPSMLPPPRPADSSGSGVGLIGSSAARSGSARLGEGAAIGSSARASRDAGFELLARRAQEALDSGRKKQAITWLRGLIQKAKTAPDIDLTNEALQLLDLDDDPRSRRDCLTYLQSRGAGEAAFANQVTRARVLAEATDAESRKRAWEELSIAYHAAQDSGQRREVLDVLEPYIEEMVFSRRFTPLLQEHPVQVGDTLLDIAIRYGTTVDAIQRLNGLTETTIQPRTRLRVLAGKPKIWVKKSEFRLWLTIDDKVLLERDIGLGKENRTPPGSFSVRVKQKQPTWYPPGGGAIPAGDPRNVLGTRWLGFKDTDKHLGFGIHCTERPSDIGAESSAGCIRLLTDDMELLYDFIPRGTPVSILD